MKSVVINRVFRWLALLSLGFLLAQFSLFAQTEYTATVNPNLVLVTNFDGWGTSLAWWANVVGGYPNRASYMAAAFSTLKLNIVRYNIGGGENPGIANTMAYRAQMLGFEPSPGVWNWNVDTNQRWVLKQAIAMGANHVVAFANSPPWWMTVSGSVTGSTNGTSNNLQTNYEAAFATYLATVVSNLTQLDGVHFDLVTPMNEPTGTWWVYGGSQEGCYMSPDQQARMVNDVHAAMTGQGLSAGIDASEDNSEQMAVNSLNAYGSAQNNVTIVSTHTYGANNPSGLRNIAANWHKPEWVSEYGDSDATGMTMARRIHDDIMGMWVHAWIYWQVVDSGGGWGFLYNPLDGSGNSTATINRKFYVMGQFSEFIRPGNEIVGVDDNNSLVAYDTTNKVLTIVAVNDTTNSFLVHYNLSGMSSLPLQARVVRTSPTENLVTLAPVSITNQTLSLTLITNSVTTMVLSNVVPGALSSAQVAWYPFENNAHDASGNGNDGTISNATFVAGKLGAYAIQFNGNGFVQIPRVVSYDFTISFWLNTTNVGGSGQWWAGKGLVDGEVSGTVDDFGVSLVGGKAALGIGNPDTTITTSNAVNDGVWHHIAATRNSVTGQLLMYVDGALQASGSGPIGPKGAPPALRIGSIQPGYAGGFLTGTMDDVQIFPRVFAASEIPSLMNHPPTIAVGPSNYAIIAGATLSITNQASDPDAPAQKLTWSLATPLTGASINATNGIFLWRPMMSQSPATNSVAVMVTDNGTPAMNATKNISIVVSRPAQPVLSSVRVGAGALSLQVSGDAGPDYIIETSTNLAVASWHPVWTNSFAVPPFAWTNQPPFSPQQFFRVRLWP